MAAQKKSPAPVDAGSEAKLHPGKIGPKHSHRKLEAQPLAIARDFGFCHAVFIRVNGAERRAGLYADIGAAHAAAADLNAIFMADEAVQ